MPSSITKKRCPLKSAFAKELQQEPADYNNLPFTNFIKTIPILIHTTAVQSSPVTLAIYYVVYIHEIYKNL